VADGRRWKSLTAAAVLVVATLAVAGRLLLGSDAGGPDLGDALVDGRELVSCMRDASRPGGDWRVQESTVQRPASPGAPWSADIQMRGYGDVTVYPNESAAAELDSRVSFDGESYAGDPPRAEHYGNVLVASYEGEEAAPAAEHVVDGCIDAAGTVPSVPAEGSFQDCGRRAHVQRVSVRGASCEEASRVIRDPYRRRLDRCQDDGGRFVCLSEYLCCMLLSHYMTDGRVEVVFDG
jgi:hypothetical protein